MLEYRRADRVSVLIQQEISDILQHQIKDPRVGFCTVTHVDVSDDLKHARIRVSIMGDDEQCQISMAGLESATGFIRREIGRRMSLRHTPEIRFVLDKSVDHILTIDKLLREITVEEQSVEDLSEE